MSNEPKIDSEATTAGQMSESERDTNAADVLRQALESMRERARAESRTELTQIISQIGNVPAAQQREAAPVETGTTERKSQRLFGYGDVQDAREVLYRNFSPEMKKWRNPGTDELSARWIRALVRNDQATMREFDLMERATIAETAFGSTANSGLATGTGGALIPLPLSNAIVLTRDKEAAIRGSGATVFQSEAATLRVPKFGSATVAMTAEGGTNSAGEPASTSVLLNKKKMTFYGAFTLEALQDSAFNLVNILTERGGSAFAAKEDSQLCIPSGDPVNITGGLDSPNSDSAGAQAVTEVAEASSTVLTYADVVKLYFTGLNKQYRSQGVFYGNAGMMQYLSSLEDQNGRPIFAPGLAAAQIVNDAAPGQVGAIFGRPVYEVPVAAGNLYFMLPSRIGILEGQRIAMNTTDALGFATDTIYFKMIARWDGAILDNDAYSRISGITSVA